MDQCQGLLSCQTETLIDGRGDHSKQHKYNLVSIAVSAFGVILDGFDTMKRKSKHQLMAWLL